MKQLIKVASSRHIMVNALRASTVVGTVLNRINQGSARLAETAPSWPHVALNYLVPYLVTSHSAAGNEVDCGKPGGPGEAGRQ